MKIYTESLYEEYTEELTEYIERKLDDVFSSESGIVESLGRVVNKQTATIARLIEKLAEKNMLDAVEITEIVGDTDNHAKFTER